MALLSTFHADAGVSWSKSLSAKFSPVQITEHQKGCGEKREKIRDNYLHVGRGFDQNRNESVYVEQLYMQQ